MTTVYFIRHAQSDNTVKDDRNRPLTEKGAVDCALVTGFLKDKEIDAIFSSPYKRAMDTISEFAKVVGHPIQTVEDFREREHAWVNDWLSSVTKQWADFTYKLPGDENIEEVQNRNIAALNDVLKQNKDKKIVIGTHGFALSTIINYYDKSFGFNEFMDMVHITPWIVKMEFDGFDVALIEKINIM